MLRFFVGKSKNINNSKTYPNIALCINCGLNLHRLWLIL
jgi:hypothetical protein